MKLAVNMGNKQYGKDVERKTKDPVIPNFRSLEFTSILGAKSSDDSLMSSLEFLKGRLE